MSQEKKPRGRPRVYSTNAERKKAYRERKKAERIELEKRVLDLESKLGVGASTSEVIHDPILQMTYTDIKESDSTQLINISKKLRRRIPETITIFSPLHVLLDELVKNYNSLHEPELSRKPILLVFSESISNNQKYLQDLSILHIIENELAIRENLSVDEYELQILEKRIDELEQEVRRKKDLKTIKL